MVITQERRTSSVLPTLALIWSCLAVSLGVWWWPAQRYPFGPGDPDSFGTVLGILPAALVPPVVVAAGTWGLVAAVLARVRPAGRGAMAVVVGTAVVYAVGFGLVVPGLQPLTLVGYLMAMFGPVALFCAVLAGRGAGAAVRGQWVCWCWWWR
ncbi:MAG TPA: hypothetical protein VFE39_17800 [Pseudonocardia sp.]|nr:hypothetical protein [Pseudonocardia sp.]